MHTRIQKQCVCVTHTHTYIHTYTHTYIHTYIHTSIHPSIHPSMHACMHACIVSILVAVRALTMANGLGFKAFKTSPTKVALNPKLPHAFVLGHFRQRSIAQPTMDRPKALNRPLTETRLCTDSGSKSLRTEPGHLRCTCLLRTPMQRSETQHSFREARRLPWKGPTSTKCCQVTNEQLAPRVCHVRI